MKYREGRAMRLLLSLSFSVLLALTSGCGKQRVARKEGERINLDQNVTSEPKPQDIIFVDFNKNWRQFINKSPELALPVAAAETGAKKPAWVPLVNTQCVFSTDAGGLQPQVTLTWNETGSGTAGGASRVLRFDLTVHHDGFARNYYSTVLATDKLKRFSLPSNSALIDNPEAVLLTGPGLFPKLMDFQIESLQERDTNRPYQRYTLILRDFGQGLTYSIRECHLAKNEWIEDKRTVVLTPVCPNSF
jgi:hypothetical protein